MAEASQQTRSIGQYIFGKTLGEGTFGKVKLATHLLTGERVAIKILEKQKIVDQSDVERVTREIQILKLVRHPHLVQLYEIIETPKQLFLIMEFVPGGELFDYIVQNTRVKEIEAARFYAQLLSGIEYLHRLRIVHRDLKPENLLLEGRGRIKIVDFGLSNLYKQDELLKTACGSPCYAAPEMIAGKRYSGLQVDIWSSGVILFAMLAGYLPFEDPNTSALYKKILSGDYKFPKYISNEARDLIKNILNTDPTKRFGISEIRNHSWMNIFPYGLIIGQNAVPIDYDILKQLQTFGIPPDYAEKCIENNRHNHVTTAYYLLLKKHLANGGKSNADISAETFEPSSFVYRKQVTTYSQDTERKLFLNTNNQHKILNPLPLIQRKSIFPPLKKVARSTPAKEMMNLPATRGTKSRTTQSTPNTLTSPILLSSKIIRQMFLLEKTTIIQVELNSTTYRINDSENNKVLKLRTPASRNRVISDYYGRFPKKVALNHDLRQRSIDNGESINNQHIRTFYRASPIQKRI